MLLTIENSRDLYSVQLRFVYQLLFCHMYNIIFFPARECRYVFFCCCVTICDMEVIIKSSILQSNYIMARKSYGLYALMLIFALASPPSCSSVLFFQKSHAAFRRWYSLASEQYFCIFLCFIPVVFTYCPFYIVPLLLRGSSAVVLKFNGVVPLLMFSRCSTLVTFIC